LIARLALERVAVRDFRNLARVDLDLSPRLTVVSGKNGHGKTALLEAIYFAATSKSFRTPRAAELVRHGERVTSVRARFVESAADAAATPLPPLAREQLASIEVKKVGVRIDGNKPATLAEYATRSPVVVFHPQELELSSGAAGGRRLLLDRLALFRSPRSAEHRARYALALKSRQQLLRREEDVNVAELEAFEELCARHGAALTRARREAAEALAPELLASFARIAAPGLELAIRYKPGGSEDEQAARAELERQRPRDAHRPTAGFGPHRDELELELGGHAARTVASQGQHRALTLALKAAETTAIGRARGVEPILLLDDVSSELDRDRTEALFVFLGQAHGQIVITTTRPELILAPGIERSERLDLALESGRVTTLNHE
jgi:DNA replication and repair protein RecF